VLPKGPHTDTKITEKYSILMKSPQKGTAKKGTANIVMLKNVMHISTRSKAIHSFCGHSIRVREV
jgi:hypothetical protein